MEIGREKNNKIKQCERVLSIRNIGITFGTSATNIEETEIRRCPRVTREGTHRQEGRLQRTKRTTKIPKIENCRLTIGRRRDGGTKQRKHMENRKRRGVVDLSKREAHEDIERLFRRRRENDSANERRGRGGRGSRSAEG